MMQFHGGFYHKRLHLVAQTVLHSCVLDDFPAFKILYRPFVVFFFFLRQKHNKQQTNQQPKTSLVSSKHLAYNIFPNSRPVMQLMDDVGASVVTIYD